MCYEILELRNSSFSLTIFLDTFKESNSAFEQGHAGIGKVMLYVRMGKAAPKGRLG
jgi:hypothetical protein